MKKRITFQLFVAGMVLAAVAANAGTIQCTYPAPGTMYAPEEVTYVEWNLGTAAGDSMDINVYRGGMLIGKAHPRTLNDGHTGYRVEREWGTGPGYQLELVDLQGNSGFTEEFTISGIHVTQPIVGDCYLTWFETHFEWDTSTSGGSWIDVEVYQDGVYVGVGHPQTANDGSTGYRVDKAWGTGTGFQLHLTDALGNEGWSVPFAIKTGIDVTTPGEHGESYLTYESAHFRWDTATSSGSTMNIDVYHSGIIVGPAHPETANDGETGYRVLLEWGTGGGFQFLFTDADSNQGWSAPFAIERGIVVTKPDAIPDTLLTWETTEFHWDINTTNGTYVNVDIYHSGDRLGEAHPQTANDGVMGYRVQENWETGGGFQYHIVDEAGNEGWSPPFYIERGIPVTYPANESAVAFCDFQAFEWDENIAEGDSVDCDLFHNGEFVTSVHPRTANDGHTDFQYLAEWGLGPARQLRITDQAGNIGWSGPFLVSNCSPAPVLPAEAAVALHSAFPNPFNPSTTIAFNVKSASDVKLKIYDVAGHLVRTLIDGQVANPGFNEVIWNGRSDGGNLVASGVYLYRMETDGFSETKRVMLVK